MKFLGFFRRSALLEPGPAALICIAVEGELGDHQCLKLQAQHGTLMLTLILVLENPQMGAFPSKLIRSFMVIRMGDSHKKQQSFPNPSQNLSTGLH